MHVRLSRLMAKDVILLIALLRPVQCRDCDFEFHCWIWEKIETWNNGKQQPLAHA